MITLQAFAVQIRLLPISHHRRHMPHCRLSLVLYASLLIAAQCLLQLADALDVLAAIDLGQGNLPDALAGDGEEVDIATEVEEDSGHAADAQDGIEQLAVPGRDSGQAAHGNLTRVMDYYRVNERVYEIS